MSPPKTDRSIGGGGGSKKPRTSSSTQHCDLPMDVITEILSYVPVTTLLRFRCVSQAFHSLLSSDHHFALLHASRSVLRSPPTFSLSSTHLCLLSSSTPLHDLPSPHTIPPLITPTLGLVFSFSPSFVLNPITGQFLSLPTPPLPSHPLGFGLDPSSSDFKALLLHPRHLHISISSLRSPRWRLIPASFPPLFHRPGRNIGLYHGGALHWSGHARARPSGRHIILSFDLASETFRMWLGPALDSDGQYGCCFLASMGADLGFVIQGMCGSGIEVWKLASSSSSDDDDGDEDWTKEDDAVGVLKGLSLDQWDDGCRTGRTGRTIYYDCRTGRFDHIPNGNVGNNRALLSGSLISPLLL